MLVDAKGVSRLYEGRVRRLDIVLLVGAALIAMIVVGIVAEPIHVFLARALGDAEGPLLRLMINFRFHVVSLIAIFLALALGVVIGAGVIDRGVVDTLNNRLDRVEAKSDRIQSENNKLHDRERPALSRRSRRPAALRGERPPGRRRRRRRRRARRRRQPRQATSSPPRSRPTPPSPARSGSRTSGSSTSDDDVKALQTALGSTTKNKTSAPHRGRGSSSPSA